MRLGWGSGPQKGLELVLKDTEGGQQGGQGGNAAKYVRGIGYHGDRLRSRNTNRSQGSKQGSCGDWRGGGCGANKEGWWN
jgi:hypothetical protein